ncbi:MAG: hypothetical protein HOH65_09840 [Rhodospirillaceae bacterium]|nr:hypothetical protein [Rhodospirillaceae bacterium]
MAGLAEILSALVGVLRILRGDPAALSYFDISLDGFWRSYTAALIALPAHLLALALEVGSEPNAPPLAFFDYISHSMIYGVAWLAYPVAIHFICTLLEREKRFLDYIIPYNWSMIPVAYLVTLTSLIGADGSGAAYITITASAAMFWAFWRLAERLLDIGRFQAIGIVAFDVVFSAILLTALAEFAGV